MSDKPLVPRKGWLPHDPAGIRELQDDAPGSTPLLSDALWQLPGEIPNFRMVRPIGGGSYGQVWLAESLLGEYRAVKIVQRGRFHDDRPYQREFEGIRRFEPISRRHQSLVDVLYAGEGDGFFYYIMELADDLGEEAAPEDLPPGDEHGAGQLEAALPCVGRQVRPATYQPKTLRSLLRNGDGRVLPAGQCLSITLALADTLIYLHGRGLVHRDVKPSNVIFVDGQPKLADVGLVADADAECSFVGTEGYVAPEGPGKPQADLYALGMVLYEMLTGLPPKDYPRLPDGWPASPEREKLNELNQVVLRACDPNPKRRYQNAEQMRSELELLKSEGSLLRLRRLEWLTRVLALSLAVLMVALGWVLYMRQVAKTRAAENESRLRHETLLKESAHSGIAAPRAGWVEQLAVIGRLNDELGDAVALLAGDDARPLTVLRPMTAFAAAFGPGGQAIVSGAGADRAILLDRNGQHKDLPISGQGPVCWSAEGIALQFAALSDRLVLREAETGVVRREFPMPRRSPDAIGNETVLAIAADGRMVGVAGHESLMVWDAETGASLGERDEPATALAFSPDGSLLAAADCTGATRVYSIPGLDPIAELPHPYPKTPILCVAFGEDRSVPDDCETPKKRWLLATADQGANILVWDLDRRFIRSQCRGATWLAAALAFHPDGVTLASAGRNDARLWDLASGQPLLRVPEQSAGTSTALVFNREGDRLLCGGQPGAAQGTVSLWALERHRGIHTLRGLASPVRKVWFSRDSRRLAALSDSHHLAVWDVKNDRLLFRFEAPVADYADQAGGCFSEDGQRFLLAAGHSAQLYNLEHGYVLQRWELPEGQANQVQRDTRKRWLLLRRERAPGDAGHLWRLRQLDGPTTPALLLEQTENDWSTYDLAFAPGGERFLVWNSPSQATAGKVSIRVYSVADGRMLWSCPAGTHPELRVAFDPLGRWFFREIIFPDYRAVMTRFSDFADLQQITSRPNGFYEAIAPSGREFGGNGWYLPDLTGLENGIRFVPNRVALSWIAAFSPDGTLLAQATEDGVVVVLEVREFRRKMAELHHRAAKREGPSF